MNIKMEMEMENWDEKSRRGRVKEILYGKLKTCWRGNMKRTSALEKERYKETDEQGD